MKKMLGVAALVCTLLIVSCGNPMVGGATSADRAAASSDLLVDQGDYYVLGGDMLLSKNDSNQQEFIAALQNASASSGSRGLKTVATQLWPNNAVPYYISGNFQGPTLGILYSAMAYLQQNCNISFVISSASDSHALQILAPDAARPLGQATVGYTTNAKYQMAYGDSQNAGAFGAYTVHDLCHVLGLMHEHQRFDRDSYVKVNLAAIKPENQADFKIIPLTTSYRTGPWYNSRIVTVTNSTVYGGYDFNSVMHATAYLNNVSSAANRTASITRLAQYGNIYDVGSSTGLLSAQDCSTLLQLYGQPTPPNRPGDTGRPTY